MSQSVSSVFFTHYEIAAPTYESVNSFKKDISRDLLFLLPTLGSSSVIHDNACGPGIVTAEIQALFQSRSSVPPKLHATDFSPAMISLLDSKATEGQWSNVVTAVMDAEKLGFESDTFTHSITNFGIFLFPDPERSIKEIFRTLKPGGTAVVTSWATLSWLTMLQDVQRRVNPEAPTWEGPFAGWMGSERLRKTMVAGGFDDKNIEVKRIETVLNGDTRDAYLNAMRDAWTGRITENWNEQTRHHFQTALGVEYESIKREDRDMEVVTAVALAGK